MPGAPAVCGHRSFDRRHRLLLGHLFFQKEKNRALRGLLQMSFADVKGCGGAGSGENPGDPGIPGENHPLHHPKFQLDERILPYSVETLYKIITTL